MTGCRSELLAPDYYVSQRAVVLCTVSGCDHRACKGGPFRVVLIGIKKEAYGYVAYTHVFMPEVGKWSEPCSTLNIVVDAFIEDMPTVFVQDALYFMLAYDDDDYDDDMAILKYDTSSNCLSLIDAPPRETPPSDGAILMSMEDGSLGFTHLDGLNLHLWSIQMGSSWTQRIVVNLNELLPIQNIKETLRLTGSVESTDIIFVTTDLGIYEINLKSLQWKKLRKTKNYHNLFPYMSFYNTQGIYLFCYLGKTLILVSGTNKKWKCLIRLKVTCDVLYVLRKTSSAMCSQVLQLVNLRKNLPNFQYR
jgi:hypothetical protein